MGKHFYVNEMHAEHPNCMANPVHGKVCNMLFSSLFLYIIFIVSNA